MLLVLKSMNQAYVVHNMESDPISHVSDMTEKEKGRKSNWKQVERRKPFNSGVSLKSAADSVVDGSEIDPIGQVSAMEREKTDWIHVV